MTQIIRITGAPTKNRPSILAKLFNRVYSKIGNISSNNLTIDDFYPNQIIYHKNFGVMKVLGTNEKNNSVYVSLSNGEEKQLVIKYAPIFINMKEYVKWAAERDSLENEKPVTQWDLIQHRNNNENRGGGTFFGDYLRQGASNRHLEARADENKLTAGKMAKVLSQILKRKVLASDISHLATEWHHAGVFYNKYTKRTSGKKVFFFTKNDINRLTEILK